MRGFLLVVTVLIALLAVFAVAMLPDRHVGSRSVHFGQPPEFIWYAAVDIENTPAWRPDLNEVIQLADNGGHPVWRERYADGSVVVLETVESVPMRRLVRRTVKTTLPFASTWTIDIVPAGDGCTVTVAEEREIRNAVVRFVGRFVNNRGPTVDRYLAALGQKLGEPVRPLP
jgi:Polyketide cyclase / dehydrase and lipid transport